MSNSHPPIAHDIFTAYGFNLIRGKGTWAFCWCHRFLRNPTSAAHSNTTTDAGAGTGTDASAGTGSSLSGVPRYGTAGVPGVSGTPIQKPSIRSKVTENENA